jgi:hypothetical protein
MLQGLGSVPLRVVSLALFVRAVVGMCLPVLYKNSAREAHDSSSAGCERSAIPSQQHCGACCHLLCRECIVARTVQEHV